MLDEKGTFSALSATVKRINGKAVEEEGTSEDLPENRGCLSRGQGYAEYLRKIRDPGSSFFGPGFFLSGLKVISFIKEKK